MSRRKRKITNPTVRKRARVGGKWRPITSMKEQAVVAGGYPTSEGREWRTDADDGD
jgi:hypothetical protein